MFNAKGFITILAAVAIAALTAACAPDAASQSGVPPPAANPPGAANPGPVAPASDTMQTVRIPVEGMSCVACAARVKKTLKAIAGVDEVEVHLGERNARVRFDSRRLAPAHLVAAITELGYSAGTPVSAPR
ncbi:MAG TPA: heavy-metal-associated domain-containing protein [Gemmatimonadaceae bacterium]|nr:heavy-metal-associated domain-containing protein [Gemmatimonadaceae bacterium]